MPIPDYQTLMLPVLQCAADGEVQNSEVVNKLALEFDLTQEEIAEVLPSGQQSRFSNRVGEQRHCKAFMQKWSKPE